jgi:hypothetical protein
MPQAMFRYMEGVFHLHSWTEAVLFVNFEAVFEVVFWVGLFDTMRVYVIPQEENRLELLLAKPVRRVEYLAAALGPRLGINLAVGIILSVVYYGLVCWLNQPVAAIPWFCGCLLLIVFAVLLLSLINWIFLYLQETYYALLVGFAVFTAFMLPRSVFIYRPDLFEGKTYLLNTIFFPANLLWFWDHLFTITLAAVPIFLVGIFLFTGLAVWQLGRKDI